MTWGSASCGKFVGQGDAGANAAPASRRVASLRQARWVRRGWREGGGWLAHTCRAGELLQAKHQREEEMFLAHLRAMFSVHDDEPAAALPAEALQVELAH